MSSTFIFILGGLDLHCTLWVTFIIFIYYII